MQHTHKNGIILNILLEVSTLNNAINICFVIICIFTPLRNLKAGYALGYLKFKGKMVKAT
jgi:hypothetical protein